MRPKTTRLIVAVTVASIAAASYWGLQPTLHIEVQGRTAVIHTELLGDYPTDLKNIELREADSKRIIWSAVADGAMFQMHSVALSIGENTSQPGVYSGSMRSTTPTGAAPFVLNAGTRYQVQVCSAFYIPVCHSDSFEWPAS